MEKKEDGRLKRWLVNLIPGVVGIREIEPDLSIGKGEIVLIEDMIMNILMLSMAMMGAMGIEPAGDVVAVAGLYALNRMAIATLGTRWQGRPKPRR